ncbi:MAG: nucleoside phosphorylase [Bacteroidales bacterium]|nr:nucleoside phosphorylase [Bacteroidales bacterium]
MVQDSELTLAPDGTLYHIRLNASTLADNVILVGDPGRVEMFKPMFSSIEHESYNREMHAITGLCQGKPLTVLSTGMGTDNIDIVMTELDACANMDLATRCPKAEHRTLNIVRIGTSGSLQAAIPCGSLVASAYAVGLDGLLNYYEHTPSNLERELTNHIVAHLNLPAAFAKPYGASASQQLITSIAHDMHHGITATAPGFYAPQGRHVRIAPTIHDLNERLASFRYGGCILTNLEMETSAIYGLSSIMGHNALTVCLIIANRPTGQFLNDYHAPMQELIEKVVARF